MSSVLALPPSAPTLDEDAWEDLLNFIEEKRVVPIVGPELLKVETGAGPCLLGRLAGKVCHMSLWHTADIVTRAADAPCPIDLLAVHKELRIEHACLGDDLAAQHHGCTEDEIDRERFAGLV